MRAANLSNKSVSCSRNHTLLGGANIAPSAFNCSLLLHVIDFASPCDVEERDEVQKITDIKLQQDMKNVN